ncbi:hypothetical protein MHOL44478_17800 [Mycobacterium holsaticum DSM 44478]|nr:hypothetical protein [Mycolicibacterium holsaticum DSM 44478 = JCM 12374]
MTALVGTTTDIAPWLIPRNRKTNPAAVPTPDSAPHHRSTADGDGAIATRAATTATTNPAN